MLPVTYTTASVPPQQTTSQTWWQGLFDLGREVIRRALPVPGEPQGGVPGVPLRPGEPAQPAPVTSFLDSNIAGIPVALILAGLVIFLVVRR